MCFTLILIRKPSAHLVMNSFCVLSQDTLAGHTHGYREASILAESSNSGSVVILPHPWPALSQAAFTSNITISLRHYQCRFSEVLFHDRVCAFLGIGRAKVFYSKIRDGLLAFLSDVQPSELVVHSYAKHVVVQKTKNKTVGH